VLLQRVEAKDYLDVEALLRSGLRLSEGLAATAALFRGSLNALDAAKAVAWFKDGDLEARLPPSTKLFLTEASKSIDPAALHPMPLASGHLSLRAPV
jgi:hypothetical protein